MPAKVSKQSKLTRGTHRAYREHTSAAPDALNFVPEPPAELDQRGKSEWARLAPIIVDMGILRVSDLLALERLCRMLVQEKELVELLEREGYLIDGVGGGRKAHPACRMLETLRTQIGVLFDKFGLTPKAREAISIGSGAPGTKFSNSRPQTDEENPLLKFLVPYKPGDPWPPKSVKRKK